MIPSLGVVPTALFTMGALPVRGLGPRGETHQVLDGYGLLTGVVRLADGELSNSRFPAGISPLSNVCSQ
jgi:hypothetical protein